MKTNINQLPCQVKDFVDMFFAQKQLYERATGTYKPPVEERRQIVCCDRKKILTDSPQKENSKSLRILGGNSNVN